MFTFIVTLIRFVCTSLVCENKNDGDKFYRRKSMWAADEKLIINELGPYSLGVELQSYTVSKYSVLFSALLDHQHGAVTCMSPVEVSVTEIKIESGHFQELIEGLK